MGGWIGVDLDGTLAEYGGWRGPDHIGAPIAVMVARVKQWLSEGRTVQIFTARVCLDEGNVARTAIEEWCERHIGEILPVTCTKDYGMIELWDDRAVQVEINTGRRMDGGE